MILIASLHPSKVPATLEPAHAHDAVSCHVQHAKGSSMGFQPAQRESSIRKKMQGQFAIQAARHI